MKRFKLSFAALIAVVAVGLTITANAGMFKNTVLAPEDFCYVTNVQSKLVCTSALVNLASTENCAQADQYETKPLFTISTASRFPTTDIPVNCIGASIFCCAELQRVATPDCTTGTPVQPQLTIDGVTSYYRVKTVHCKAI